MDLALRDIIYSAPHTFPHLVARNVTSGTKGEDKPPSYKLIGLALAVGSGLFIGVSFVLKKYGLLKANAKYNEEAGEGYGYLKNYYWWGGMTLMIIGEICNFAAYLFADAILVTPLGALSVVVCAILSSIILKERLSFVGKVGCFACIVGAIVIACNAPEQPAVSTIQEMKTHMISAPFLSYAGVIIVGCAIVAIWVAPKYGKKSMLVYLTICSLIGGLSVVCIQGLGAAITAQSRGIPQFNQWFLYFLLVFVISTLVTEIIYLNKALNLYNAALVTPTYYVYFTSATIVSDAVLYRGFRGSPIQIITVVLGFLQICSGVVLLQLSKSSKDIPDTAVFSGDLDQVRTVAEQEEPEYEPRADTMRGTAALIRSMSSIRHKRETLDVMRIKEEAMAPIGEGEEVEWDGLRRRRTMSSPRTPQMRRLSRGKSVHPPLGMSRFPDVEEEEDPDNGMHPGFWSHFKRKPVGESGESGSVQLGPVSHSGSLTVGDDHPPRTAFTSSPSSSRSSHIFGLPTVLRRPSKLNDGAPPPPAHKEMLKDTSYHGATEPIVPTRVQSHHVQWSSGVSEPQATAAQSRSRGNTIDSEPDASGPFIPTQPPHITLKDIPSDESEAANRRQFSFSSIFNRQPSRDGASGKATESSTVGGSRSASSPARPAGPATTTRSGLSFSRRVGLVSGTEEERAGLVKGDASAPDSSPPRYESPQSSPTRAPATTSAYPSRGDSLVRQPGVPAARRTELRASQVISEDGIEAESTAVRPTITMLPSDGVSPLSQPPPTAPKKDDDEAGAGASAGAGTAGAQNRAFI